MPSVNTFEGRTYLYHFDQMPNISLSEFLHVYYSDTEQISTRKFAAVLGTPCLSASCLNVNVKVMAERCSH